MAKYSRLTVLTTMIETGLIPVFYQDNHQVAIDIINACLAGGARCVEFTNRGDGAHMVFGELSKYFRDNKDLILGAGSILDPYTADLYIQMGANFIVGPNLSSETARLCNRRKIAYCPGCGSVTEISEAEELGVEICKMFPGEEVGGPEFIHSVKGPMPWVHLMPTGGVSPEKENIYAWIQAGAACLGIGSKLISNKLIESRQFGTMTANVQQILAWIQEARGGISLI
jgi:2-dehydro-3-deoxyphosphogluconate aldolase/(4S)-4-hydroxy-2-oxoglutarate aldolase